MAAPVCAVSCSGGKDSTACAVLAVERIAPSHVRLVFADTGNEHEDTLSYVNDYLPQALGLPVVTVRADFSGQIQRKREYVRDKWPEKGVSEAIIERALAILEPSGNPFLDLCIWKGRFPSRRAQFCTHFLKILPIAEYQLDLLEDFDAVESWQGIRADESTWRANAVEREELGGGMSVYRPILNWTAQRTVDFVRSRGLELNPLYRRGMSRVGCMPCINATKPELREIANRFPDHIDRIAEWEAIVRQASKRDCGTFFPTEKTLGRGVAANMLARGLTDKAIAENGGIHAAVWWARTSRGMQNLDLFNMPAAQSLACASSYGLCE